MFARTSSVAPSSDLIDGAAAGAVADGGAEAQDTVSVATAMRASGHGIVALATTSIRSCAIAASPVALALELHGVPYTGDAGNPPCDALSSVQRIRRPNVAAEVRHAVIDADLDIAEIVDRVGFERSMDPLGGRGIGPFLFG